MKRWQRWVAAVLAAVVSAGCGAAAAQERKASYEHGVLEWIHYRAAKEERERYSWATAAEEIERDSAAAFFGALGVAAHQQRTAADRISVLDHLAAAGWELVNRTDVGYADAGGSAFAERYVLRRRR
jgi:hypothetical protein